LKKPPGILLWVRRRLKIPFWIISSIIWTFDPVADQ
jgi:hypothetical protein